MACPCDGSRRVCAVIGAHGVWGPVARFPLPRTNLRILAPLSPQLALHRNRQGTPVIGARRRNAALSGSGSRSDWRLCVTISTPRQGHDVGYLRVALEACPPQNLMIIPVPRLDGAGMAAAVLAMAGTAVVEYLKAHDLPLDPPPENLIVCRPQTRRPILQDVCSPSKGLPGK